MNEPVSFDPQFVAVALRTIREHDGADAASFAAKTGLSYAQYKALEAGDEPVDKASLGRVAQALGCGIDVFIAPRDEELDALAAQLSDDIRRLVLVELKPLVTPLQVAAFVAHGFHALRRQINHIPEEAAEMADALAESLETLNLLWEELEEGERVRYTTDIAWHIKSMQHKGVACRVGFHRQRARLEPDMVATVGVVLITPSGGDEGDRGLLVQLEPDWENLEADRARVQQLLMG